MKTLLVLAACAALVPGALAQDKKTGKQDAAKPAAGGPKVEIPFFGNEKCGYMKGKKTKPGNFVETTHGKVYLCCHDCSEDAQKDGEAAYEKGYPKSKTIDSKKCPVSGHDLGKDAVAMKWQGYEFKLCCKDCVEAFKKNPDAYLALMTNTKLKDVGNATCPVSGEAADGACVIVEGEVVRVHSRKDAEEFKKDAAKYLAKAKEEKKGSDKPADKKGG